MTTPHGLPHARSAARARLVPFGALALALLLFPGCPGKRRPALAAPGEQPAEAAGEATGREATRPLDEGPDVRALEDEDALAAESGLGSASLPEDGGPLADIRFDYDSAALSEAARATLDAHAAWLQRQRDAQVTIEGHCDERGTVEYNLALGEQRARAVRDYLVSLGVGGERLRLVSYGKERPLDSALTEEAYARNRRAHFALDR